MYDSQYKQIKAMDASCPTIYGYRDGDRSKWTEERQADIIQENIEVYK